MLARNIRRGTQAAHPSVAAVRLCVDKEAPPAISVRDAPDRKGMQTTAFDQLGGQNACQPAPAKLKRAECTLDMGGFEACWKAQFADSKTCNYGQC